MHDQSTSLQNTSLTLDQEKNNLLTTVMPLLSILINLKNSEPEEDLRVINTFLIHCLNTFEQNAYHLGFSTRQILAVKYCFCTALDEAIMCTPWGREGIWNEMSLLSTFYKETFGGERFYIIVETMLEDPPLNAPLLEVLYILLRLGFKGKNYNKDPLIQKAIQQDLWEKIEPYLQKKTDYFLDTYKNALPKKQTTLPMWLIAVVFFVLILIASLIFNYHVESVTNPIFKVLDTINETLNSVIVKK